MIPLYFFHLISRLSVSHADHHCLQGVNKLDVAKIELLNQYKFYRDAPDGLRLWGGATVEQADMEALMPWLAWAYQQVTS